MTPATVHYGRADLTAARRQVLFFTLNREDFSFVIHLDRQPRTSRRREAQTGSRARSGSRSERTLDAVEHSRTLMEWWPFLIFHRGGLRIKVINNTRSSSKLIGLIPSASCTEHLNLRFCPHRSGSTRRPGKRRHRRPQEPLPSCRPYLGYPRIRAIRKRSRRTPIASAPNSRPVLH